MTTKKLFKRNEFVLQFLFHQTEKKRNKIKDRNTMVIEETHYV